MMGLQWLKNTLLQIEEFGDAFTRGGGDLLKLTTDRFVWEKGFRKWHSVLQNTSQKFNFSNVGNLMKSFNFYIHLLQFHQIFVKLCKYHILIPWPELMVFLFSMDSDRTSSASPRVIFAVVEVPWRASWSFFATKFQFPQRQKHRKTTTVGANMSW